MQERFPSANTHDLILGDRVIRFNHDSRTFAHRGIALDGFTEKNEPAFPVFGNNVPVWSTDEPCPELLNECRSRPIILKPRSDHHRAHDDIANGLDRYLYSRSFFLDDEFNVVLGSSGSPSSFQGLPADYSACDDSHEYERPLGGCIPFWRFWCGTLCWFATLAVLYYYRDRARIGGALLCNFLLMVGGTLIWATGKVPCEGGHYCNQQDNSFHNGEIVPRKYLTSNSYWGTVRDMANVLNKDTKIAVIGALAEGSSIRSIERVTGVHRDTIMRLGVKVGNGCASVMDSTMRNLPCNRLEMDEIWGFVGKKDRNVREGENAVGSVWTFCAIDAETKLVPAFKVGDRSVATAKAFVQDVATRMAHRVQISTDGLAAYVVAMESAFGADVDYAQIIKVYGHEETSNNRRYSAPEFVSSEKIIFAGSPDPRLISTSYVERLNATTRLHMRRLTRLTLAFSKKRENFEAAIALHFAYYNFVKRHTTIRCTPAMAAGVTNSFWSVGDLVEAAA